VRSHPAGYRIQHEGKTYMSRTSNRIPMWAQVTIAVAALLVAVGLVLLALTS
jgi:hypothetical protein